MLKEKMSGMMGKTVKRRPEVGDRDDINVLKIFKRRLEE